MVTERTFNDNHHSCRQVFTATKLNENIEVTLDTNFDSLLNQVREAFNSKIHRIVSSLRDGNQVNFKECLEDLQSLSFQHTNEILDGIKKSFKELSASHTKEVNEHLEKSLDHLSSELRMKQKREENIWKRRLNTCRIATKIEKNNDTYLNKTLLDDAHRESSLLHTREVNNVSTALQKVVHNLEEREEENRILTKINKDFEKKTRETDELLRKNVLYLQRSEEESKKLEKEIGRIQNKLAKSVFSEACLKTELEKTIKHAVSLEVQLKASRHQEAELEDNVLILKSKTEEQANESKELKKKIRVLKTISIDNIAVRRSSKALMKQPATEMCGSTSSISAKCKLGMKVHSIKQKTSNCHIQENTNVSALCFDSNDTKIGHDDKLPSNVITFLDEKCALIKGLENILFVKEKEMSQMKKSTQGCIKKIEAYENILKPKKFDTSFIIRQSRQA